MESSRSDCLLSVSRISVSGEKEWLHTNLSQIFVNMESIQWTVVGYGPYGGVHSTKVTLVLLTQLPGVEFSATYNLGMIIYVTNWQSIEQSLNTVNRSNLLQVHYDTIKMHT